jgi:hypothetical protein
VTSSHKAPADAVNLSCKLAFELDLHGLVRCTSATHNHKVEIEEPAPVETPAKASLGSASKEDAKAASKSADAQSSRENDDASNMETEDASAPGAKPAMIKKTKKVGPLLPLYLFCCRAGTFPCILMHGKMGD